MEFTESDKKSAKRFAKLCEDEIGKKPKHMFCLRLVAQSARGENEAREVWLSRLFIENEPLIRDHSSK